MRFLLAALAALVLSFTATSLSAQTVLDVNKPLNITFSASADHNAVVGTTAILSSYAVTFYDGSSPVLVFSCGKPTLVGGNVTCVATPAQIQTLPKNKLIQLAEIAIGPGGSTPSALSDPFFSAAAPASAGRPQVSQ